MADMSRDEILVLAERYDEFEKSSKNRGQRAEIQDRPEGVTFWQRVATEDATIARALRLLAGEMGEPVAYRYRLRPDFAWHLAASVPIEVKGDADWDVEPLYVAPSARAYAEDNNRG